MEQVLESGKMPLYDLFFPGRPTLRAQKGWNQPQEMETAFWRAS